MNSILQCLSQTIELTKYFLNENNKNRIINNNIEQQKKNELQLSPVYLELIQNLWKNDKTKSFSPKIIIERIQKMNSSFDKGHDGDCKDFIIFILKQLHKELKTSNNQNIKNGNQRVSQYDRNTTFNNFINDFKNNISIISDIFFGTNETLNGCLNCKNNFNIRGMNMPLCYNYEIFNCIIFPLEGVKNMKNNSMQYNNNFNQMNQNQNYSVTIYDCFYYNQKLETFTGENKNYCNLCKQLSDTNHLSRIFVSPNVLILILNRGKDKIINDKLFFYEKIDITQFVIQKDKPQITYNLYGVITYIGINGPEANFNASCKSSIDNKWYRFNDSKVNLIEDFQKEVIDYGIPYILFYRKNN